MIQSGSQPVSSMTRTARKTKETIVGELIPGFFQQSVENRTERQACFGIQNFGILA